MDGVGISENPCCHVGEEFDEGELYEFEWSIFVCGHPGPEEHYFDVEKNKENCNEIEFDRKSLASVSDGSHTTLIGSILVGGVSFGTEYPTDSRKDNA